MVETEEQLIKALEEDIYDYCVFDLHNEKYPNLTNLEIAEAITKTIKNIEKEIKIENQTNFTMDLKQCIKEHLTNTEPYISLPPYKTIISPSERYKKLKDSDIIKALIKNVERFMYKWELEEDLDSYIQKIIKEKEEYRQYLSPFDIVKVLYELALGYS